MTDTTNGTTTIREKIAADIATVGPLPETVPGAIGRTMFDLPGSEDLSVTVLLPAENLQRAPAQAMVRIFSQNDRRKYLGVVTAGPFAEPDSLKGDSPILVTVSTRGGSYLPPFHGRVVVTILGEELADGTLTPPRLRPLPNSPVCVLSDDESAAVLKAHGNLRLGLAVGHSELVVGVPSDEKSVLPRHTAILGTTGGGKSTTVAGLIRQAQAAGMAVILLDVEGEYARLHEPTDDPSMLTRLAERGLEPGGIPGNQMTLYHLVNRDTVNPKHPNRRPFSVQFARLSPYAVIEILNLTEAQQERFLKAYDITKELMRRLEIFPVKGNDEQERMAIEIDEFERGYPRLTLSMLIDVAGACHDHIERPAKEGRGKAADADVAREFRLFHRRFNTDDGKKALTMLLNSSQLPASSVSWRALLGRLGRLNRMKVFYTEDRDASPPIKYSDMLEPGRVSVVDLSDTGMSELNNFVIADLLHGIQEAQDRACEEFEKNPTAKPPTKVLIIIEEAHEFLSAERVEKMPILFQQVARLAKRGRKRWLGLVFVTQLPGHLPRQVLSLCNNLILHKLIDTHVLSMLKLAVSGIDESLWSRLPGLAPGQAIVSFGHMTRPLMVAIDPTGAKLRLVD
jgi:hypothetical protein